MAAVASCTPPASPHSPARKKAKFSLRLKGKNKAKKSDEVVEVGDETPKKLYPIFSPVGESPDQASMVPPPAFVGLKNRSNLCYANAVLQVLRKCPGFVEFVDDLRHEQIKSLDAESDDSKTESTNDKQTEEAAVSAMICQLQKLLHEMKDIKADFIENKENCPYLSNRGGRMVLAAEPCDFMEAFRNIHSTFENHLQHDAQEFLRTLIITLHEASKTYKNKNQSVKNLSAKKCPVRKQLVLEKSGKLIRKEVTLEETNPIEELFQGRLVHETKCLTCENAKQRFEDFQDVSVPVCEDQQVLDAKKKLMLSPTPKKDQEVKKHTLEWAISQFATVECLKDDNKYFCENCMSHMEARISTCFDQLPSVLTIHLKRFTSVYSGFSPGFVSKITSNLETPLWLSVQEWSSDKCCRQSTTYELFAIVMHSGMTSCSGHYQAYIKMNSKGKAPNMEQGSCVSGDSLQGKGSNMEQGSCVSGDSLQGKGPNMEQGWCVSGDSLQGKGPNMEQGSCTSGDFLQGKGPDMKQGSCVSGDSLQDSVNTLTNGVKEEQHCVDKVNKCEEALMCSEKIGGDGMRLENVGQKLEDNQSAIKGSHATSEPDGQPNGDVTCDDDTSDGKSKKRKSKLANKSSKRAAKRRSSRVNSSSSSADLDDDEATNRNAAKKPRLDAHSPERGNHEGTSPDLAKASGQVTCSFGLTNITKFFLRTRKKSVKEDKVEEKAGNYTKAGCEDATNGTVEHSGVNKSCSYALDNVNKCGAKKGCFSETSPSGTLTPALCPRTRAKVKILSKSPAIRQLTFQVGDNGLTLCNKSPESHTDKTPVKYTENLDSNNNINESMTPMLGSIEGVPQGSEWVHFDDSEVYVLDDADVAAILSSAESSFNSPYLLFYRRCER